VSLASVLFPLRCPGCGRPADPVCDTCARTLRPPPAAAPPVGVDAWVAAFAYEGAARELVARAKYDQARAAIPWLAAALAGALAAHFPAPALDAVTWAPTTASRRRQRGFDHAQLLARRVARTLGLPLRPRLRRRPGPPQTGLPSAARRVGPSFSPVGPSFAGRLLLVDDVATTGATLSAAAAALRAGGARTVVAATVARTPRIGRAL
jgi:predicted amidophosphoribosyltransferase